MRWMDLSWAQAKAVLDETKVALLPIGSVENHGPHLPLATDLYSAERVAEVASRRGGWPLLPTVPIGVSEHHRQFPGTLWVPPRVLKTYVESIVRAVASHGVRRVVLVNGHGGNTGALDMAARALRGERIYCYIFEWWVAIADLLAETCNIPHDHAGEMETSMILAIRPDLVDTARYEAAAAPGVTTWGIRRNGVSTAFDTIDFTATGVVGDPAAASAEKGARFTEASAEQLDEFCRWLVERSEEELAPTPHL